LRRYEVRKCSLRADILWTSRLRGFGAKPVTY